MPTDDHRPRQSGPDTDEPPAYRRTEPARPRQQETQAEQAVSDVSSTAARRGEQPFTVWSSERAFVLSTAAAGIGLGNLWRFPTMLGENGGGTFLLCYAIAVIAISVPFATLEIAAGRMAHGSTVTTFRRLGHRFVALGWAIVTLTLIIDSYYFVITGWTLGFALEATFGSIPTFEAFTSGYASVWYLVAVSALVAGVLMNGLQGIERFAQFVMPALVVAIAGLAAFGLLNGFGTRTLSFLFEPELAGLSDPTVWRAAFGQAFFSLTVGQGYLITYGSYLPARINVVRSVSVIAVANSTVAILAGLAIFPLVFAAGLSPAAGSELAFDTLPSAFEAFGSGAILAAAFFWLFFLAAFSSCIGGAKVVTAAFRERIGEFRARTAVLTGIAAITVLGVPSALSYSAASWQIDSVPVLDYVDRSVGTNGVIALGLASTAGLAWRLSPARWQRQLGLRSQSTSDVLVWLGRLGPLLIPSVVAVTVTCMVA